MNFSDLRARIPIERVLTHYQIPYKRVNGDQARAKCPFPKHTAKHGEDLSVNLTKNLFQCHSCKEKGSIFDFVLAMGDARTVKEAGEKLAGWFDGAPAGVPERPEPEEVTHNQTLEVTHNQTLAERWGKPEAECYLRGISYHPYLEARGITQKTAAEFGVGFYGGKGKLTGRIVFPVHSPEGKLLSYIGRTISDDPEVPRWYFPQGFKTSLELYNLHRVASEAVLLVESSWSVLWAEQAGIPAVAMFGSSLSERQAELLSRFRRVVVMMDGDSAGKEATPKIVSRLAPHVFVRAVEIPEQPTDLTLDELKSVPLL